MKSILQKNDDECYTCGATQWIEEHHIFGNAKRKISEANGFKIKLCHYCHNEPSDGKRPAGVHYDIELDYNLRALCQEKYEQSHSHEDFMKLIGRNYL